MPWTPDPEDLIAVHVPTEDLGDFSLTQTGWYGVDDGGKVVLGPFESLAQCDRAIRDRLQEQEAWACALDRPP